MGCGKIGKNGGKMNIARIEAMIAAWKTHAQNYPETKHVIQEGLNKLEGYNERTDLAPAYILAMGVCLSLYLCPV